MSSETKELLCDTHQSKDSEMIDTMQSEELRLVLIGKTGSGKSASGNTILGRKAFESRLSGSSITKTCQLEAVDLDEEHDGRRVVVIDTPGYGNTDLSEEEVHTELSKCVSLSAPEPHAFLLVVPLGRYNEDDDRAVDQVAEIFGEEAVHQHMLVLFTRGDDLDGPIDGFVRTSPPGLQALIKRCGGRYHVFNNKNARDSLQVKKLISKVENTAEQTATGFYNIFIDAAIMTGLRNLLRGQHQSGNQGPGGCSKGRQTQPDSSSSSSCLQYCMNAAMTAGAAVGAAVSRVVTLAATAVVNFVSSPLAGAPAGAGTAEAATEDDSAREAV